VDEGISSNDWTRIESLSMYQELYHDAGSTCYPELLCYYHLEETVAEGKPLVGTEHHH